MVSFTLTPQLWLDWLHYLTSGSVQPRYGHMAFAVRLAVAFGLVVVAARRKRYWLLAISAALASPVMHLPAEVSLLTAIPRLRTAQDPDRSSDEDSR